MSFLEPEWFDRFKCSYVVNNSRCFKCFTLKMYDIQVFSPSLGPYKNIIVKRTQGHTVAVLGCFLLILSRKNMNRQFECAINDNYKHHYGLVSDEIVTNVFHSKCLLSSHERSKWIAYLTTVNAFYSAVRPAAVCFIRLYCLDYFVLVISLFPRSDFCWICCGYQNAQFPFSLIDFLIILGEWDINYL